jgi:SAM-dependent methyltransferase
MSTVAELYADKRHGYFHGARTDIEPVLPQRAASVLEIGCGGGGTLRWLRSVRTVEYAMGIELMADAARDAHGAFDDVVVGNIETDEIDLPAERFDLILALDVLEHLVDPWRAVERCHRALKPGGAFIASIPNVANYSVALPLLLRGRWTYADEGLLDRTHLRFFVERTAVDLMTSSGLVFEAMSRNRMTPRWLTRWPGHLGAKRLRWYAQKILAHAPGTA